VTDRVNLNDVAREAGVHASTASRALNPQTRSVVRAETVERVLSAAQRLGYRPNPLARGLRTDKTYTVGMVVPDLENPLFPPLVRGAEQVLGAKGYSLLVGNTDNDRAHTEAVVGALTDRLVDGLISATAERGSSLEERVRAAGTPVVLVNRAAEDSDLPAIVGDDRLGIGLAVDHLVELGHRHIGHVAGPPQLSTGVGRAAAFDHHLERHGLASDHRVEAAAWFQVEPGHEATRTLLDRHPDLTAIVAANDLLALGALRALTASRRRVPEDVSVTGYNDMPFVDMLQPPLTTVRVPYREMGAMAAEALLELLADPEAVVPSRRLAPSLCVRASTAPPP
jgi:LacI family transcriptional regulator